MKLKQYAYSLVLEVIKQESRSQLANTTKVNLINQSYLDLFLNEEGLEFKEENVYPNGAVYKGQLKLATDLRHGFGI